MIRVSARLSHNTSHEHRMFRVTFFSFLRSRPNPLVSNHSHVD